MKVTVTKAGNHSAVVGSTWTLANSSVDEALRTGIAPLYNGGWCHVPVECIEVDFGGWLEYAKNKQG